jgi:MFS family permease
VADFRRLLIEPVPRKTPPMTARRTRLVAARALATVTAVFWGFLWFGLIDLLVVVIQDEEFHQDYLFESGWGLLYLVLVAVPLAVLVFRPGNPVALSQLVVVTVAVLVGAAWAWRLPQLWNGLGLAVTVGLVAVLGRGGVVRWSRPDTALSVLAVVGVPAAAAYGAPLAGNTTFVEDITNGVSHYPMQAALGLAVVGLVALAALTRSRLPAWTASFTTIWLGVESMVYPDLRASLGTLGGGLAIAWGVLVVAAVEVARRREVDRYRRAAT